MASGSGVEKNALAASSNAGNQSQSAFNSINPIYNNLASGTVGYTPTEKANQLTASSQSLGGGVAGAVGQGGLLAARTGNAGGATAALDDASRQAGVQQGENALGVQNASDQLATQNQRVGLSGLNSIYSGGNSAGENYLGTANSAQQAAAARTQGYVKMGLGALAGAAGA